MDNNNKPQISNLSFALKSVHLNNGHDDDSNSSSSSNRMNMNDSTTHHPDLLAPDSQISTNANDTSSAASRAATAPQLSRISNFFQNQPTSGITLFSHRSAPNGFKVAIILSELNLNYRTIFLDFNNGEQRAPEFVAINPNARVPAIIDHDNNNLPVWESGAIILYLIDKYILSNYSNSNSCSLYSSDIGLKSQILSWLFFQTSGHAPMIGQALHFRYFHSQSVPSAVERYTDEVRRVYGVVEMALAERREALIMELDVDNAANYSAGITPLSQSKFFDYPVWLVGDHVSVADLSFVPWNNVVDRIGINIKVEFPEVYKWTKHMMRRPSVIRALRGE